MSPDDAGIPPNDAGYRPTRGVTVRTPDPQRVERRADELLPEEQRVGSDDPVAQAEGILAESDERTLTRGDPTGTPLEHRRSEETVDPT
jgi:hypothetical protein